MKYRRRHVAEARTIKRSSSSQFRWDSKYSAEGSSRTVVPKRSWTALSMPVSLTEYHVLDSLCTTTAVSCRNLKIYWYVSNLFSNGETKKQPCEDGMGRILQNSKHFVSCVQRFESILVQRHYNLPHLPVPFPLIVYRCSPAVLCSTEVALYRSSRVQRSRQRSNRGQFDRRTQYEIAKRCIQLPERQSLVFEVFSKF